MVKVLLFIGGLAILLVSSRQVFLMFRDGSFRARGNRLIVHERTPHNLLDEFRWARAFRRCRCRVDLLAIAYLSDQLGTGRSQLIAWAAGAWPQRTQPSPRRGLNRTPHAPVPAACTCVTSAQVEDLIRPPKRAAPR